MEYLERYANSRLYFRQILKLIDRSMRQVLMDRIKYSHGRNIKRYRIHSFSAVYILRFAFRFVRFTTVSRSFLYFIYSGLSQISISRNMHARKRTQ